MKIKPSITVHETLGIAREAVPVSFGLPLPKSMVFESNNFSIETQENRYPCQTRPLAYWPNGSLKWLHVTTNIKSDANESQSLLVSPQPDSEAMLDGTFGVDEVEEGIKVRGGAQDWLLRVNSTELLETSAPDRKVQILVQDERSEVAFLRHERLAVEVQGPLQCVIVADGEVVVRRKSLNIRVRYTFNAESPAIKTEVVVTNKSAAKHRRGLWDLGDKGSIKLRDISLRVTGSEVDTTEIRTSHTGQPVVMKKSQTATLYQDSSGGENWQSSSHIDAKGKSTVSFAGYRLMVDGETTATGSRAEPLLSAKSADGESTIALDGFWQNFPSAMRVEHEGVSVGLFPHESRQVFELQGGEQKRHTVCLCVGAKDTYSSLIQCSPLQVSLDPAYVEQTGVLPFFAPQEKDTNERYRGYVDSIVRGQNSAVAKWESFDEYGWRNYGDLVADHEAVNAPNPTQFVSHYNNQYDFVFAAGIHHLRSADSRWKDLLLTSAHHLIDIDIYHTDQDRPAYNGGMFWHTDHYVSAGTATHRTYSKVNAQGNRQYGGGPSNEHCYTSGLLLYYYLTGDIEAARCVRELADWIIAMDNGRLTVMSLVTEQPTGLASQTVSSDFHGPGRGAGNAINACLDAHTLTGKRFYFEKADELIRRCIHPDDDIERLNLSEPEYTWSYLAFLQTLGKYLEIKCELGEFDYEFAYARASLLHYAEWIKQHERPYGDMLDKVELPTETWPAHDVRKAQILGMAARYIPQSSDRDRYLRKSEYFFDRAMEDLLAFETAFKTRPQVIMASMGYTQAYFRSERSESQPTCQIGPHDYGMPSQFVPQKRQLKRAIRQKTDLFRQAIVRLI